ncbi:MAG: CapA family protein [Actinomycetota bacterium]
MPKSLRASVILVGGLFVGLVAFLLVGDVPPGDAAVPLPATTTEVPATTVAPPTTAGRGSLVIHAVGDVNTDISYIPALATHGHGHAWDGLDGLFGRDDLTVVNLECTPSELGQPADKEFVFRCDPDSLPAMGKAGVDVVNLANNHSRDHGPEALLDGRARVEEAGMAPVGVGRDRAEAASAAIVEANGWKVAVLGFGGVVPNPGWVAGDDHPGMADGNDIPSMVAAVEAAQAQADLVVVTVHWGVERDLQPRAEDRRRAEELIGAGADAIFGHHPHRLQPLEMVDGVPVAWSLGNFVWPDLSRASSTTAVARVEIAPDGGVRACLVPAFITSPGHPELTADPVC